MIGTSEETQQPWGQVGFVSQVLWGQSPAGCQPKPTCSFPPFSFLHKKVENPGREQLLPWLRGNWKKSEGGHECRFLVWCHEKALLVLQQAWQHQQPNYLFNYNCCP